MKRIKARSAHTARAQRSVGGVASRATRTARTALSKASRTALALTLALTLCGGLTGCKDTDVLTEYLYDQEAGQLDPDANPVYVDSPRADHLDSAENETQEDVDQEDQTQQTQETYNEENPTDTDSQVAQGTTAENTETEGEQEGEGTGNASSPSSKTNTTTSASGNRKPSTLTEDDLTQDDSSQDQDNQQQQSSSQQQTTGNVNPTGGNGGEAKIYDGDGSYDELPTGTRIAATGQYAQIVCMLSGGYANGNGNPLVASDYNFLAEVDSKGVFPGEGVGLQETTVAWTGSEDVGWTLDLSALSAAKPDIVLVGKDSGWMSTELNEQLTEAGIDVVIMPTIGDAYALDADIDKAVQVVGEILKDAGTKYDTRDAASKYVNFKTSVKNELIDGDHNAGYTTFMQDGGYVLAYLLQGATMTGTSTANLSTNRRLTCYIDDWVSANGASTISEGRSYRNVTLYPSSSPTDMDDIDITDGAGTCLAYPINSTVSTNGYNDFPFSGITSSGVA